MTTIEVVGSAKQLPVAPPLPPELLAQLASTSSLHGGSRKAAANKTGTLGAGAAGGGGGATSPNGEQGGLSSQNIYMSCSKEMIYNQDLHEKLIKEIHNKSLERSKKDSSIFLDEHGNLINKPTNRVYSSSSNNNSNPNPSQFKLHKLNAKFKVNRSRFHILKSNTLHAY